MDTETTSEQPVRAELVGISICAEDEKACYIPVAHAQGDQLNKEEVLSVPTPSLGRSEPSEAGSEYQVQT